MCFCSHWPDVVPSHFPIGPVVSLIQNAYCCFHEWAQQLKNSQMQQHGVFVPAPLVCGLHLQNTEFLLKDTLTVSIARSSPVAPFGIVSIKPFFLPNTFEIQRRPMDFGCKIISSTVSLPNAAQHSPLIIFLPT